MKNKFLFVISIMLVLGLVLAACKPTETTTPVVEEPETVVEEPTEEVIVEPEVTRTGPWIDEVVFTAIADQDTAVAQVQAGAIDVYPVTMDDVGLFESIKADANLKYTMQVGGYNQLLFNTVVCTDTTILNPFSNMKIREAMNWAIDRDYVVEEILGGLGYAKLTMISIASTDYARYAGTIGAMVAKYAYDLEKAKAVVDAEMVAMGAELVDGKWSFGGKPVIVIGLIRTEDNRRQIGNYFGNQLEALGFTVDRQEKPRADAGPIWTGDPLPCTWSYYTGGWISTAISLDEGSNFGWFSTPLGQPYGPMQLYEPSERLYELSEALWVNDFASMEERDAMFEEIIPLDLTEAWPGIWVNENTSYEPFRADLEVASDLAGGIATSPLWALTAKIGGQEGGTLRVAQSGIMVQPFNPVAGSNWVDDSMVNRGLGDFATITNPYTGLAEAQRIERAECEAVTGTPTAKQLDWVDLKFVDSIAVDPEAWADWDAVNQVFVPAGEGKTAVTKCTVYYPADLWTKMFWHNGSPLTIGDFVMSMILTFDLGKADSMIFDPAQEEAIASFLGHFKGVKIESIDPLVITTYEDRFYMNTENMVSTWYPTWSYGQAGWDAFTLMVLGEENGELAFSSDKATLAEAEWTNLIAGPSLEILKTYLDQAQAENYIPYAPTMGEFVTAEEATLRYTNLQNWYAEKGHFLVALGPLFLDQVATVEQTLVLKWNPYFPDKSDKWAGFGEAQIAEATVEGPISVKKGDAAEFDVLITFEGMPYPLADINAVTYVLFDGSGNVVGEGVAEAVEDGLYKLTLPADQTGALAAGAAKLSVGVGSKLVAIPTFATYEFAVTE